MMQENLILSILITANNMASAVMGQFGADAMASLGMVGGGALLLGGAIAAIGGAALAAAVPFDQSMHKIAALTVTNAKELAYFKEQILTLGPSMDMSANDMAKALYFIKSAGFDGADAITVLKYSAMAATAGMTDQKTVADALTSVLNSYKDQLKSVGTVQEQVGYTTDVLNKMVALGKMDWSSFVATIGFTAVTASATGVKLDELGASVATLSSVSGSHGIRRMENDLNNLMRSLTSVDDVAKRADAQLKFEGLAQNFDKATFAASPFIDKIKQLAVVAGFKPEQFDPGKNKDILNKYQDINQSQGPEAASKYLALMGAEGVSAFEKLVGGAAAFIPAVVLLSDHTKTYSSNLAQMKEKTGEFGQSTVNSFNTMRESSGQQFKMLELAIQNIFVALGLHLLPAVNSVLEALRGGALAIVAWISMPGSFDLVMSAVRGIGLVILAIVLPAIVGMVAAAIPMIATIAVLIIVGILVGKVLDAMGKHWHSVGGFMNDTGVAATAIKVALAMLAVWILSVLVMAFYGWAAAALSAAAATIAATWPIILIVIAIGLVIFAIVMLITHWHQVIAKLHEFGTAVAKAFNSIKEGIGQKLGEVGAHIGAFFQSIGTHIHNWAVGAGKFLAAFGASVFAAIGGLLGGIGSHVGAAFNSIGTHIHNWAVGAGRFLASLGTALVHGAEGAFGLLVGFLRGVLYFIVGLFVILFESNPIFKRMVDGVVAIFHLFVAGIQYDINLVKHIFTTVVAFIGALLHVLGSWFSARFAAISLLVHIAMSTISALFTRVWTAISQFIQGVVTAIVSFVVNTFHEWVAAIQQKLAMAALAVQTALNLIETYIIAPIGRALGWVGDRFGEFVTWITTFFADLLKKFDAWWSGIAASVLALAGILLKNFQDSVSTPISNEFGKLLKSAEDWGKNLIKNFVSGITSKFNDVKKAIGGIMDIGKNALQGKSPPAGWPEMGDYGPNFVRVFSQGITNNLPLVTSAMQKLMATSNGSIRIGTSGAAVGVGSSSGALLGSTGPVTHIHNWANAFPNATNADGIADAIANALDVRERKNSTLARRAGTYQGLRAGK